MGDRLRCSRRRVLEALATTGATGLAGCAGAGSNDERDRTARNATQDAEGYFSTGPEVGLREVGAGTLSQPVAFATAEEDRDRRFVADQRGLVYVHEPDGVREEPFLDVRDRMVSLGGVTEMGLLGLAFHPEFADNRRFFVRYSAPPREDGYVGPDGRAIPGGVNHTFVLAEFRATEDFRRADPDSERILLEIPEPQGNHNAGAIAFGPDESLYVAVGDGGGGGDTGPGHVEDWYDANGGGNGQDVTENLLGSVLRIDVDDGDDRPYAIPEENPLVGSEGLDEHFAWGFRNPWGLSFDLETGRLFVADVGQRLFEEVNIVERGGNYGWNVKEASSCFDPSSPGDPPADCPDEAAADIRGGEQLRDPIVEYPQNHEGEPVGRSVVGGYVYRGSAIPELEGQYVFGDWTGRLFVARQTDGGTWETRTLGVPDSERGRLDRFLPAFGRGRDGDVYALTSDDRSPGGNGRIYRLVPADDE